jgi:hypothetical protein
VISVNFLEEFFALYGSWLGLAMTFFGASVAALISSRIIFSSRLRYSHKIAVIGFPGAGKTTMISMMFSRIMRTVIAKNIRVSGKETISRISELYERVVSGKNVGPSTDQDVFSYRFQVDSSSKFSLLKRQYDVEIADFPGEYSEDLASSDPEFHIERLISYPLSRSHLPEKKLRPLASLYGETYQTWVTQADEYIIVIDLDALLKDDSNRVAIQAKLLSAVLSLKEASIEGGNRLSDKDAVLVFSKADIIASVENESEDYRSSVNYVAANSGKFKFDLQYYENRKIEIIQENRNIIDLLQANFGRVAWIFHSSYSENEVFERSERALINFVMPGHFKLSAGGRLGKGATT